MRRRTSLEYLRSPIKRRLDLVGGTAIAAALLPIEVITAVISSVDTRSANPFFRQMRVGHEGQTLDVIKFRTLPRRVDGEELQTLGASDPRASFVGRTLREIGVDETPQLINVIRGEMSLVGMRPLLQQTLEEMEDASPRLFARWFPTYTALKPAVTGPSQIYRHQYRSHTPDVLVESMRLDLDYVMNASLINDLRIIGSTPLRLLNARIHMVDNHQTEVPPAAAELV